MATKQPASLTVWKSLTQPLNFLPPKLVFSGQQCVFGNLHTFTQYSTGSTVGRIPSAWPCDAVYFYRPSLQGLHASAEHRGGSVLPGVNCAALLLLKWRHLLWTGGLHHPLLLALPHAPVHESRLAHYTQLPGRCGKGRGGAVPVGGGVGGGRGQQNWWRMVVVWSSCLLVRIDREQGVCGRA